MEVRHGVTFGADARSRASGPYILVHETGHLFGLPDLYDYGRSGGDIHRHVGDLDLMGNVFQSRRFLAWHKWKLGWLDPAQLRCLNGSGTLEETLSPVDTAGGVKAVVVPLTESRAYVVEVASSSGSAIVYSVDATVPTGSGPIRVAAGPLAQRYGAESTFNDASTGVTVEVLISSDAGARVRVTRR